MALTLGASSRRAVLQVMPDPLFSFSACLGAVMNPAVLARRAPWLAGPLMSCAVFAPAALIVVGVLPFRDLLRQSIGVHLVLTGISADVVGLLVAACIEPVWPAAMHSLGVVLLAGVALAALLRRRVSPLWVETGSAESASLSALIRATPSALRQSA